MTIPETLGRAPVRSPEQRRTFGQTMTPWLWLVQPEASSPPIAPCSQANLPPISCTRINKLLVRLVRRKSCERPRHTGQDFLRSVLVLAVVLFAGGLFGNGQGVISGALGGIEATFTLSPLMIEVVTSWVTLGALFGSLAGGELADRFGHERTMLIAGALFTLGYAGSIGSA